MTEGAIRPGVLRTTTGRARRKIGGKITSPSAPSIITEREWASVAGAHGDTAEVHSETAGVQPSDVIRRPVIPPPRGKLPAVVPLPDAPPERWHRNDAENPAQFIARVYGPWLGKGLTRSHLLTLDEPLYRYFSAWSRKKGNDLPPGFDLPTRKEANDRLIAMMQTRPDAVPMKDYERLTVAMKRRREK